MFWFKPYCGDSLKMPTNVCLFFLILMHSCVDICLEEFIARPYFMFTAAFSDQQRQAQRKSLLSLVSLCVLFPPRLCFVSVLVFLTFNHLAHAAPLAFAKTIVYLTFTSMSAVSQFRVGVFLLIPL